MLAEKLRTRIEAIVEQHQVAYLPGRNINLALTTIRQRVSNKLKRGYALVNLDFSKAFDRVDRGYLLKLLQPFVFNQTLHTIKLIYETTQSVIEVHGHLSRSIRLERGVRQGCPLSALLFILAIEPLQQAIQKSTHVLSYASWKVISYADDITCFVRNSSLENFSTSLKTSTQLSLNKTKMETLSKQPTYLFTNTRAPRILGVTFTLDGANPDLVTLTKNQLTRYSGLLNKCRSLHAKAKTMNSFILPKFLHIARHLNSPQEISVSAQLFIMGK